MDFIQHYLVQMSIQFWIPDWNVWIFLKLFSLMLKAAFTFKSLGIFFLSLFLTNESFISPVAFLVTAPGSAVACFRPNLTL